MFWLLVLLVWLSEKKKIRKKRKHGSLRLLFPAADSQMMELPMSIQMRRLTVKVLAIHTGCQLLVWISASVKSTLVFLYTPASATVTLAAWQHCSLSYQRYRGGLKQRGYKGQNQSLHQLFFINVQGSFDLCWYTPVSRFNSLFESTPIYMSSRVLPISIVFHCLDCCSDLHSIKI